MKLLAPLLLLFAGCATSRQVSVYFFITTDCPIANSFAPEINRIVSEYRSRDVAFSMVYTDLKQPAETARRHASEYRYESPVLLDSGRVLSRSHGISVTPEVLLLGRDGSRLYRGRIDDRYLAPGKYRLQPTTRELRDAIEAVLDGRAVAVAETKAAGCPLTE